MKITKITHLPAWLKQLRHEVTLLNERIAHYDKKIVQIDHIDNRSKKVEADVEELKHLANKLMQRNSELEHLVTINQRKLQPASAQSSPATKRFVDNHQLDDFYIELENNFRGTEAEIQNKQRIYLDLFQKSNVDFTKHPVIDLGSGRGEFVSLLSKNKVNTIGVDLNESMVERMKAKKLNAAHGDAIDYIAKSKSNSLGAITGFHLAEHLPFAELMTLIAEARRALVDGGFLLLETPNPENLKVGAFTFHYDPSHLKPLPPAILDFMAKFKGFKKTDILRLQPELSAQQIKVVKDPQLQKVLQDLYGPRDFALVAYK